MNTVDTTPMPNAEFMPSNVDCIDKRILKNVVLDHVIEGFNAWRAISAPHQRRGQGTVNVYGS